MRFFGIIQKEAGRFYRQVLAASGIIRKEFTEMQVPDLLVMDRQRFPGRSVG